MTGSPFRARLTPRSALADRVLDWRTEARISAGDLVSTVVQSLRGAARALYTLLCSMAYRKKGNTAQVGARRLAALAGFNERTIRRALRDLVDAGLVQVRRCFGMDRDWSSPGDLPNEITVLRPAESVAAQDRRRRRESGEEIPELELESVIVLQVEHDPGSEESLAAQAARVARASALALRGAVEAELGALAQAAGLLDTLPRFEKPAGWARWKHFSAAQDCLRAIEGAKHARRAIESASAALGEGLAALVQEEPGPRGWACCLAELRLALGQAAAVAGLVQEATSAAERARATWAPLLVARPAPAAPRGEQGELQLEAAPARAPLEGWRAPEGWAPTIGPRSARTWLNQREVWRQAESLAHGARTRIQEKLRAQGFDPGWPDPLTP